MVVPKIGGCGGKSFSGIVLAISVTVGLACSTVPATARACKNGVCAESRDDGRTVNVYLSSQLSGHTHYNVNVAGYPGQREISGNRFSFGAKPGRTQSYSVQSCKRGGTFSSSTCLKWAAFSHTVDREAADLHSPQAPIEQLASRCRRRFVRPLSGC